MNSQFAEVIVKQIRKELNNLADNAASGTCNSYEEYKYLCGVIRGLAIAEEYVIDLAKKIEEEQ